MTAEERFKMLQSDTKIHGTRALIRHHNPAYEGIVNAGFLHEDKAPQNSRKFQHMFSNGHTSKVEPISDTETERSMGEVVIPMTTFGKRNQIVLDASQLK